MILFYSYGMSCCQYVTVRFCCVTSGGFQSVALKLDVVICVCVLIFLSPNISDTHTAVDNVELCDESILG